MPESTFTPLRTKLYRPPTGSGLVVRPRLLEKLNQSIARPLTVIVAPAGYGKTTLVTSWLDATGHDYAWLSLDENDADLATFVAYLIEALRQAIPALGSTANGALRGPSLPSPTILADLLLQDLAGLAQPLFVIFDDYHVISNPDVRAFMERVLANLPGDLHLILITRSDPVLPLGRLRGRQQIIEVRSAELRFTASEAEKLVRRIAGEDLRAELISLLTERTEGWPVGLQLAAISLRDSADQGAFARRFAQNNHLLLTDYLVSEVLDGLPEAQRLLMLRTSIFDRFCAPLCEAITEDVPPPGTGADFIATLRHANLFLIELDDEGVWYRYHLLFRDLLRHQLRQTLSADEIAAQNQRAGRWFEDAGLIEEAIAQAIQGGDDIRAARLVEANMTAALNLDNWRRLEHWLALLPGPMLQRPALLIAQAYLQQFRHKITAMISLIEAAEGALNADPAGYTAAERQNLLGAMNALRATSFIPRNPEEMVNTARLALTQLNPEMIFARSLAELWQVYGLQHIGQTQAAVELAYKSLSRQSEQTDTHTLRMLLVLGGIYFSEANLSGLIPVTATFLEVARRANRALSLGWANFLRGWAHYQSNELDAAAEYFGNVTTASYEVHSKAGIDSFVGLTLTYHAQGRETAARQTIADLRKFLLDRDMIDRIPIADSLTLRLFPLRQAFEPLAHLTHDLEGQLTADLWETPALTAARLALRSNRPDDLAGAAEVLRVAQTLAQARNNKRQRIEIYALQTQVYAAQGRRADALAALRQAVLLGEPGGTLRFLADEGFALRPYLQQLLTAGVAPAYIQSILAAYQPDAVATPTLALSLPPGGGLSPSEAGPTDILTNRELDVLLLLEQRLTNKEIAARLIISPRTVQKHTISIYEKLQVGNRRQAVARARACGLLSETS